MASSAGGLTNFTALLMLTWLNGRKSLQLGSKILLRIFPEKWKLLRHDKEDCCFVKSSAKSAFAVGAVFSCLKSFGHVGNLPDTSMLPLPAVNHFP